MKTVWDKSYEMCNRKIRKLQKEIENLRWAQHDNESIYGFGGSYQRKENAIRKREKEITQLEAFKQQSAKPLNITEVLLYTMHCKECKSTIYVPNTFLRRLPAEGWHECPVCRKMINGRFDRAKIQLVENSLRYVEQ